MASSTSVWSLRNTGKYLCSSVAAQETCDYSMTLLLSDPTSQEKLRNVKNAYCMLLDITGHPMPAYVSIRLADIEKRQALATQVQEYFTVIPENKPGRESHTIRLTAAMSMSDVSFANSLVNLLMEQDPWTFAPTM